MVMHKRQPACCFIGRSVRTGHVSSDSIAARRAETEQPQRVPYSFSTPQRILTAESANQLSHFLRNPGPSTSSLRLPAPIKMKHLGVPFLYRCGLHKLHCLMPGSPNSREKYPKEPEGMGESGFRLILFLNSTLACSQLTFCGQNSYCQSRP